MAERMNEGHAGHVAPSRAGGQNAVQGAKRTRGITKNVPRREPRERLPEGPPFTVDSLRALLTDKVRRGPKGLRQTLAEPGDAELAELVRILAVWKGWYLHDQEVDRPLHELHQRASDALAALEALAEVLSRVKEQNQAFHAAAARDAAPSRVQAMLEERLLNIARTLKFIEASHGLEFLGIESATPLGWKWLGDALPEDFYNAMKPANPQFKCGISHNGPAARFIAAVAPAITGEHPTAGSIATHLKQRRSRGKATT
jgi:hypothetical protein